MQLEEKKKKKTQTNSTFDYYFMSVCLSISCFRSLTLFLSNAHNISRICVGRSASCIRIKFKLERNSLGQIELNQIDCYARIHRHASFEHIDPICQSFQPVLFKLNVGKNATNLVIKNETWIKTRAHTQCISFTFFLSMLDASARVCV